jgi:hypothetical protein
VAIDVPLIVFVAVVPVCQALVIATPGASRSTQEPWLLNDAARSVAPTVSAAGTRAGEEAQASCATPEALPFPAATA